MTRHTSTSRAGRGGLSVEERAAKVEELTAQLHDAVERLAGSAEWLTMLQASVRFHRYSPRNVLLLWVQALERGISLSRVAGYRTWLGLGRQVRKGEKAYKVLAPVHRRLTVEEAADRRARGIVPAYDSEGRPAVVVRGFRVESVFDLAQTDGDPLPETPDLVTLTGAGPAGLWDALADLVTSEGFALERNEPRAGESGYTDYPARVVSVRPGVDEAEAVRILAHELGHVRADHEHRQISREQRETEADSIAYVVCTAAGLDLSDTAVPYVTGWSGGDVEVLQAAAETVHRVAASVLADLDARLRPTTDTDEFDTDDGADRADVDPLPATA